MEDFIFTPLVMLLGLGLHSALRRRFEGDDRSWLDLSFATHMVSGLSMIALHDFYYGGDMGVYHMFGVPIAEGLRSDFGRIAPEMVAAFFHLEHQLPMQLFSEGSSATMTIIAATLFFLLGNSLWAAGMALAVFAYLSKAAMYEAFKPGLADRERRLLAIALFVVPSGVAWSTMLLKEPVAIGVLGPMLLAGRWILDGKRFTFATLVLIAGGVVLLMLKPYLLLAFAAGAAAWFFGARVLSWRGSILTQPTYLALSVTALVGAYTVVSYLVPTLSLERVPQSTMTQRRASAGDEGGSNFSLEDGELTRQDDRSLLQELALAPLGLATALYRPTLLEVKNPMMLASALETTWLLWLTLSLFLTRRRATVIGRIVRSPALLFCVAFVGVVALGTGLSTANLGTLARYRAPMMPFFSFLLMMLRTQQEELDRPSRVLATS